MNKNFGGDLMAKKDSDKNPFIAIPASMGGIYLVVVVLFLIFAQSQLVFLTGLLWGFVVLGVFATFFAYLSGRPHKKK